RHLLPPVQLQDRRFGAARPRRAIRLAPYLPVAEAQSRAAGKVRATRQPGAGSERLVSRAGGGRGAAGEGVRQRGEGTESGRHPVERSTEGTGGPVGGKQLRRRFRQPQDRGATVASCT